MSSFTIFSGLKHALNEIVPEVNGEIKSGQDVTIKFFSAQGLPKMDVIGTADPYFIANIDNEITYKSTVLANTLSPEWKDEEWIVRNIPLNAKLTVTVYDKDDDSLTDDCIGKFEITDLTDYKASSTGHRIEDASDKPRGFFHLAIESTLLTETSEKLPRYTFDGPCRFIRHSSPTVGFLTMINTTRLYSTWKIDLRRISVYFSSSERQQWNRQYPVAQNIFGTTPRALAKQRTFKLAHKVLYGTTLKNHKSGRITNADDLWKLIFYDTEAKEIRKCIYTYIIDDYSWRFSETGAAFFTDYASKHALHANCAQSVRYAGEFYPQPKFGWDRCDDEWELVFNNASGTYAPCQELLKNLKELLEFNFHGLNVVVYDRKDTLAQESEQAIRFAIAKSKRSSILSDLVSTSFSFFKK